MASSKKRSYRTLTTLLVLAGAGGLSWLGAREAANYIEQQSRIEVQTALNIGGQDWVTVGSDGLQILLTGAAPSEVERFRAVTQAGTAIDPRRIVDHMTIAKAEVIDPPDFKIELLRNDQGISLIGLVPAETDREAFVSRLSRETAAPKITDLLESADYPVPPKWQETVEFGLRALQLMPQTKISIEPGAVRISGLAESRTEQAQLEGQLKNLLPDDVTLETQISAPRPVVAPFTLRFAIDDKGARFDACAANNEDSRKRILDAAVKAGVKDGADCVLALGSPTPEWPEAAVAVIGAVAALGQGSATISDAEIVLKAPSTIDQKKFDDVVGNLEQALPGVFTLQAELESSQDAEQGPVEFSATLAQDGTVAMRGRITDRQMQDAVNSFAQARFAKVEGVLRTDDSTPGGWTVKVIAGLEAISLLHKGNVKVTPDLIDISGVSGDSRAAEHVASVLAARLGPGAKYQLSVRYDRRLDPTLALPSGRECVDRLNIIMSESAIGFEPNKAAIAGDPSDTLARMKEALKDCEEFQIEAGGHTDSQGSDGFNADLSRSRAQALVKVMEEAGIDTTHISSRGYGESQPVMSNDTDEGREANRRIEFRLLSENPVRSEPLPAPMTLDGVTGGVNGRQPQTPSETEMRGQPPDSEAVTKRMSRASPATLGASEEFESLDEREENLRLPVQIADENTPRPPVRPDTDETEQSEAE